MQRWLSILLGIAAVGLAIAVVVRTMSEHPLVPHAEAHPDAASPLDAKLATDAGKPRDGGALDPLAALGHLPVPEAGATVDPASLALGHYPDGRPVPPLPDGSPKQVKLGIVLLTFSGAQGAPPNARPRKEAEALATKLAQDAKTDFHGAVVRGDSGSSDDIGRIPRGVLEPVLEYTVFTMPVGTTSDPIETPRGFWIAKRTE